MKNKMLILSLFLVVCTINTFKNINAIDIAEEFVNNVFDDTFFKEEDQLELKKLIKLIKNDTFENFKNYFETCLIDINTPLNMDLDSKNENEEESKTEDELSKEDNEKTLLMFALEKGDFQLIEYLICQGVDVNAEGNNITPLSIAVLKNDIKSAKLLIEKGAKVNASIETSDNDGYTLFGILPKYFYKRNIEVDMVKLLMENGYDFNEEAIDDYNYSLLDYCLFTLDYTVPKEKEVIEYLFWFIGEEFCQSFDWEDSYILDTAILQTDNDNAIKYAIEKEIIDVDFIDAKRCTALFNASLKGNLDLVKFLIENNADVNFQGEHSSDLTALMVACERGHRSVVAELLNAGADVTIKDKGVTAYDIAKRDYEYAKATRNCKEIYKYGKTIKVLNQWNENLAKEVMKNIPNFPVDLIGIIADKVTDSSLKADELKNINKAINCEISKNKEEKEHAEKSLETAVKKKKRNRDSDNEQLDPSDPNYNLC